ncbi:unnamed protein product [Polarella glacialis]|uniref:Uncharacterized protein n=1 Tax=Polarella glacialis TaxID=89957 RepID=A0A813LGH1_POLGL|nr:unnamed protein product [Polarella glacialis]
MADKRIGKNTNKLVHNSSGQQLHAALSSFPPQGPTGFLEEYCADNGFDDSEVKDEFPPSDSIWTPGPPCVEIEELEDDMPVAAVPSVGSALPQAKAIVEEAKAEPVKELTLLERFQALEAEVSTLKKRQDQWAEKSDDSDAVRRGQLDCFSERLFQAEKTLRLTEERSDDAIEKARAAFMKTSSDMEQERSNLMCVITQVNQNFEHLSGELAQLTDTVTCIRQELTQTQQVVAQLDSHSELVALSNEVAHLEEQQSEQGHEFERVERAMTGHMMDMKQQQKDVMELRNEVRVSRESLVRLANAGTSEEVTEQLGEFRNLFGDMQVHCQLLDQKFSSVRHEVPGIVEAVVKSRFDALQELIQRSASISHPEPLRPDMADGRGGWNKQITPQQPPMRLEARHGDLRPGSEQIIGMPNAGNVWLDTDRLERNHSDLAGFSQQSDYEDDDLEELDHLQNGFAQSNSAGLDDAFAEQMRNLQLLRQLQVNTGAELDMNPGFQDMSSHGLSMDSWQGGGRQHEMLQQLQHEPSPEDLRWLNQQTTASMQAAGLSGGRLRPPVPDATSLPPAIWSTRMAGNMA